MTVSDEASVLATYLTGRPMPPGGRERLARACATLLPGPPSPEDAAILSFALRHPRWLGPLDAALALVRPAALLRSRVLVAAAVIEATPEGCDAFLPRAVSKGRLAWLGLRAGLVTVAWLAAGLPLLGWLTFMARLRA